jgi:hypothetical protein
MVLSLEYQGSTAYYPQAIAEILTKFEATYARIRRIAAAIGKHVKCSPSMLKAPYTMVTQ